MTEEFPRPLSGALSRFTRDLTADAREGRLEPVRCRDAEVARVIDILLRHGKNNPALVGPAGVGKTAIVEGLAQRLAGGDVPLALRGARILAVDHMALLAGTTFRGQYEERLRVLVEETRAIPDAVLFIDELHNLIGQGTALGVAMDAANMLKPALVRGDFRVIGATTDDEYDRWIRGDPALERRFQRVLVKELSSEDTLEILRARQDRLERHHNVLISEDAMRAAVTLTDQHQTDRRRPDRAIDALDEACAHAHALARYSPRAVALIDERKRLLTRAADEPRARAAPIDEDDPIDEFARGSFAALAQFGAELEAMLVGGPVLERPGNGEPAHPPPAPPVERPATNGQRRTLAEVEAELAAVLADEGHVVRGVDVARVVAVATGHEVTWTV
ncbi:MAG TPA: AAA family ATPase [Gemmatimonadaceae bacterium]